jgi:hypothetical protein
LFYEKVKDFGLPVVVGQDRKAKFVSVNLTKRCLGKLAIVTGLNSHNEECIEYYTIIDFAKSENKNMEDINTIFNENLVSFHNTLFHKVYKNSMSIAEESEWLDAHYRNDIVKQYEHMLALNICHGILFESFPYEEEVFFRSVFEVAFTNVTRHFGIKPIVVELISDQQEILRDWNEYPQSVTTFLPQ